MMDRKSRAFSPHLPNLARPGNWTKMEEADCAEFSSSAKESSKNNKKPSHYCPDSSSSDSDDDDERIVVTKKPPPRRRKFNMNSSVAKTGNLYTGLVKDLFSVNMATLSDKHDSDEENNGGNVVFVPSKSKVRKTSPETSNPAMNSRTEDTTTLLVLSSDDEEQISCCVGIALGAWQAILFSLLNILGTSCSRPQPASEAGAAGGGGPEAGAAGGGGSGDATGSTVSEDPAADVDDAPPEEGEGSAKKQKLTGQRSPSPPPPPPMSFDSLLHDVNRLRATKARKGTEKILRGVDAALRTVRRREEPAGLSSPSTISLDCSGLSSPGTPVDREMTVKVRSRSSGTGVHRIKMRMSEKFDKIFRCMSEIEHAPVDRILLVLRDYTIQPADTPHSIGLHIADIIDCSISTASMAVEEEEETSTEGKLELKIQGKERKTEKTFTVHKSEELGRVMQEYADFRQLPLNRLQFKFDGEVVTASDTPEDLDMEGGETIDARALQ
ncbi:protein tag [Branchiostoma belcheri]|nr:protein tag [Branchiostoma belcheri]